MMVDVIMNQLDFMREKDQMNIMELQQLKERLKVFEGPTTTGFKNFSTTEAQQQAMGITSNTNSQYPMSKFSPFYPNSGTKSNFNLMQQKNQVVAATVTATEENELEQDQTVLYFDTLHKLTFLTQMLPRSSLNKDLRLVQLETFY